MSTKQVNKSLQDGARMFMLMETLDISEKERLVI